jgi:hypothetical protein
MINLFCFDREIGKRRRFTLVDWYSITHSSGLEDHITEIEAFLPSEDKNSDVL